MIRRSAWKEEKKTNVGSNKPENAWVDEDEVLTSEKAKRTQTPQREAGGTGYPDLAVTLALALC
jgi:hypothetical protein